MTLLRILLLTELVCILGYVALGICGDPWLSPELQKQVTDADERLSEQSPLVALLWGLGGLLALGMYAIAWILLWISHRFGRFLYLAALVLAFPLLVVMPLNIVSGPVSLLETFSGLVTGAILLLLFHPRLQSPGPAIPPPLPSP